MFGLALGRVVGSAGRFFKVGFSDHRSVQIGNEALMIQKAQIACGSGFSRDQVPVFATEAAPTDGWLPQAVTLMSLSIR